MNISLSKKRYFLKEFFKEKKTVGAISPSSKHLAKRMLENIDFKKSKVIIELGPGTGVFTRIITSELAEDGKLMIFELHDAFYESLKKEFANDKRVVIINDSAENIGKHLKEQGIDEVDVVVSSLPLTNFNKILVADILKQSHKCLKQSGLYIQFQYSLNAQKLLKGVFKTVRITFTPRNIPPAFVYTCIK
jgi:phospholipid N-methyltransferase